MATLDLDTLEFEMTIEEVESLERFFEEAKENALKYTTWAESFRVEVKSIQGKGPSFRRLIYRVNKF